MPILDDTPLPVFQAPKQSFRNRNLTGRRFGRLLVVGLAGRLSLATYWYCLCDCKTFCWTTSNRLKREESLSCGCLRNDITSVIKWKHGLRHTSTYTIWANMLDRTLNSSNSHYPNYGGRGIGVCDRWKDFRNFVADMGLRPKTLTLERIDNNGGYGPDNCKWATRSEQAFNRRTSRSFSFAGKTQSLAAWAREYEMGHTTLKARLDAGWSTERALTHRLQVHRKGG